jgi:hypothetical protein
MAAWSGVYYTSGSIFDGALRVATFQQWPGNQPQAPAVTAFTNELVIACGGMQMATPGFGTPTGNGNETAYTNRADVKRGAFGTGETTQADALALTTGTTGPITFPGNGDGVPTPGATATLVVQPLVLVPTGNVSPFILMNYPLT